MYRVDVIDRYEPWEQLADEWDALVAAGEDDSPFRRFAWMRAWWQHFGDGCTLRILTVRDGGHLIGIAPLFVSIEPLPFPVRTIRFLGGINVASEYLGLLIKQGAEDRVVPVLLDRMLNEMGSEWDVIRWSDIPAESRQLEIVRNELAVRDLLHVDAAGTANHVVRLPELWDDYIASLSTSRRTKIRRVRREFDERDDVEFEFVENEAQFERCWDELKTLHALHWTNEGLPGCFADPRFDAFHTEFARGCLKQNQLVLASLRLEGHAIAASYGIRQGDTVYEYQRGHDPAHIRRRPGHALQFALFERSIETGVRNWDYLRGDYQNKRDWANHRRACVDLTVPAPRSSQVARFYLECAYRRTRRRLGSFRRKVNSWLQTSLG